MTGQARRPSSRTLFIGSIVHSTSSTRLEFIERGAIYVQEGIIAWLDGEADDLEDVLKRHDLDQGEFDVVQLGEEEFICPGLIDTHTHAPQFPNIGLGGGLPLLDWLEQLTFPEEKKYSDLEYTKKVYDGVVKRTLSAGTTTCCYYATTHLEASKYLVDVCRANGQRAFIGKCCMDRNCPHDLSESTADSVESTKAFVDYCSESSRKGPGGDLVQPILTPRFALSCTPELLASLGDLARSTDPPLPIQTHMSENTAEIEATKSSFPGCQTYAEVYDKYGLLGPRTILAHCIHLEERELEVIKRTGTGISHCPISNLHLNSGVAKVRRLLDKGIKVGLGTDCSGGYSASLLPVMRSASDASKFVYFGSSSSAPLSTAEIFHLATMGGASLCGLEERIGNFEPGKEFDALRISPLQRGSSGSEGVEQLGRRFERWFWCGDERDLKSVWVRGVPVTGH